MFQGEASEAEVLLYPGTKFKVVDAMDMGAGLYMIHLEQVPTYSPHIHTQERPHTGRTEHPRARPGQANTAEQPQPAQARECERFINNAL